MNRPILSTWIDECFRLEQENRELRALVVSLLLWLADTRDLSALAKVQLKARWPGLREAP